MISIDQDLKLSGNKDELFESGRWPSPFEFNRDVAQVFDDMVSRSVPFYREVTGMTCDWALAHYKPGSAIYDIGCSTGTTIEAMARVFSRNNIAGRFVGIDNSDAMLEKAEDKLRPYLAEHEIVLRSEDAGRSLIKGASMVVVNYTLQFLPVEERLNLLKRINQGMLSGGIFVLSEKVMPACPEFFGTITGAYERFKEASGYSRNEIERKKEALDNVLVPLTLSEQMTLLAKAGFTKFEPVLKWNNFATIVALKD